MEFTNFEGSNLPQIAQNISLYDYVVLYIFQTLWWFHYHSYLRSSCIFLEKYCELLEHSTNKDNRGSPLRCTRKWNWQAPKKLNNRGARCQDIIGLKQGPLVIIIIWIIKVKEVIIKHLVQDVTGLKQGHRVFSGWVEAAFVDSTLAVAEVERENCSLE